MKRALVYNAAFPVLGGGERYAVALGTVIAESHEVTYGAPNRPEQSRLDALGFPPLHVVELTVDEFSRASADYDLAVLVASEMPPPSFAGRSVLVAQFPRDSAAVRTSPRARANLRSYERVVYSNFVRDAIRSRWGVDATVLMPGVEVPTVAPMPKEELILSVGRFVGHPRDNWTSKRQDVLIDAFGRLPEEVRRSWRLVLAGGCSPSAAMDNYLEELRARAKGLAITFSVNATPAELTDLQRRARMFWHASGFERPAEEPEQAEHFGMSTAEAMCHGAIPLVYADGGQLEIVPDDVGHLWRSIADLVAATSELAAMSHVELDERSDAARDAGRRFGLERFDDEARMLLDRIGARRSHRGLVPDDVRRTIRRYRWRVHRGAAHAYHRVAGRVRRLRSAAGRLRVRDRQ